MTQTLLKEKKKKKDKKRKMQTHPSLLKVQLLVPPARRFAMATNALLHSYQHGHHWQARQCIQVRQAGAWMPGNVFLSRKIFQKQFFKLRCLSPALVRRDKVLEEHTHGAGVSVCTRRERHLVAPTDACRKQRSNCFRVMEHQPSH